jgi:hypothetical protein
MGVVKSGRGLPQAGQLHRGVKLPSRVEAPAANKPKALSAGTTVELRTRRLEARAVQFWCLPKLCLARTESGSF